MGIQDLFSWYQQKIGTYDKQQWETKLEQKERFLHDFKNVPTRSTKPNTDLIDLDLVRGSSFTKAKPQHGFITVAKLATLRVVLLPLYDHWWIQQTSRKTFYFISVLYVAQILNIIVYYFYSKTNTVECASCMEVIIPFSMMWILSLIHSQIVSTNPGTELKKSTRKSSRQYRQRRSVVRKESQEKKSDEKNSDGTSKSRKLKFSDIVNVMNTNNTSTTNKINNGSHKYLRMHLPKRPNVDDDGFESLNGNGSRTSDEDEHKKPRRNSSADIMRKESLNIKSVDGSDTSISSSRRKRNVSFKASNDPIKSKKEYSSDSDSEYETKTYYKNPMFKKRSIPQINVTSVVDSTCDTEDDVLLTNEIMHRSFDLRGEVTSSATEWMGGTTNSDDFSSDIDDDVLDEKPEYDSDNMTYDNDLAANAILNHSTAEVTCTIWECNEIRKVDLTMLDISSAIINRVDSMPESMDYFFVGIFIAIILALLPVLCRFFNSNLDNAEVQLASDYLYGNLTKLFGGNSTLFEFYVKFYVETPMLIGNFLNIAIGVSYWEQIFILITIFQRWVLASVVFFLLAVAERTFKQRLLYAKLFSHLTSSRRARKSELPHFRLNKVRNIKTWLSVRSYLKKRGPQRSVDVIVSTAFVIALLLITFLCVELLKETVSFSQYYLEALIWSLGLGIILLRFMTLGTKINKKYRNLSVLITEQINLHLQIEQKPHKKNELTVANNVLKLAIDLLKELENPFKISGLSANPILYNVTKLVILSALSGVLSEMLGFKLKLHKIKLK